MRQLGVVVQHLLEVRHQPVRVGAVAGEAAADLVVDPAVRHPVEGEGHHLEHVGVLAAVPRAHEELQGHRRGELGSPAKAAVRGLERGGQAGDGCIELSALDIGPARLDIELVAEVRPKLPPLLDDLVATVAVRLGDRAQHPRETGHPVAVIGREVGAAEERLERRRQEDAHRPAAAAGQGLDRGHVDVVEVGPLLAVDLDRHEVAVQLVGDGGAFEGLVRHDVAPVAGRIADREEDRLVFGACPVESLSSPRIPVDGVLSMLEEVRARLGGESVGHAGRSLANCSA